MNTPLFNHHFPQQRVSGNEKRKAYWYANCIDYVIDAGLSLNDRNDAELTLNILHGNIPNSFYKKTLNPYNSNNEKYTRFPATMRNLDIMQGIVRRYVSEYFKGIHEFVVGANNPDIVINKDRKLASEITKLAEQAFQQEFQRQYQAMLQQVEQQGMDASQVNPQDAMPDIEQFIKDFNEKYIDDASQQGQDLLDYIKSYSEDILIYLSGFFNYVTLGECFSYCDIRNNNLYKENVPVIEAYPIPNDKFFVEDHDMFARKTMMSYQQILDTFGSSLSKKDRTFLETYYANATGPFSTKMLKYNQYFEDYPDVCEKFTNEERDFFKKQSITVYEDNTTLFEVWHVVWRGEAKRGILQTVDQTGFISERVVEEDYEFNPEAGDINIEWVYEPQVYEGYRIGNRYTAIYPIKARPIAYNRNGKLPYNGILEILPMMGKFSIVKLITPFQILRNIMSYHREMVVAKNKLLVLLLPESLINDDAEDKIYKMAADGVLYYDDSEDSNSTKAQQIRLLNANIGDYINQLTQLIESIKYEAWEVVDMNQQRYGDIAQSAGAATTQEAVARSSMGSVIITQMFDEFRKHDYNRDLDYAKLAFIDGLDTSYFDTQGQQRYLSLDVNSFVNSQLSTIVKNDAKELDKIQQLKQWAFSAAQNGDLDMAIAAITGDNVSAIKKTVARFSELKRQHEEQMQRMEQMIKQEEIENRIREIEAKGEQDRLTEQLKYQYELQLKYLDIDINLEPEKAPDTQTAAIAEANKKEIEANKINLERQRMQVDMYNAAADRQVKREQMINDLKIAKTNKNRYDKK